MRGKVRRVYEDHVDTDAIIPARYLMLDRKMLTEHAMEDLDESFIDETGDFIVAGEDFGCGSSREHAVWVLMDNDIKAVIASSFARIFYRNAINNGLMVIEVEGAKEKFSEGNKLEISEKIIKNLTKGEEYEFKPMDFAKKIIDAGGLLNYVKDEMRGA
jgi:3-isopropylmalate/(R)-2-methylmalate dehydratase small subunit